MHRVAADGPKPHEVVRSVPLDVFRGQVEVLRRLGDIVAAADLASSPSTGSRPRFALTFDDDYPSQLVAAQLLADMGVPGTFFLSGRSLAGLGRYWWEHLEDEIEEHGTARTADRLAVPRGTPQAIAAACEGTDRIRLLTEARREGPAPMTPQELRTLSELPGITIGFHTVHHPVLPMLPPPAVEDAMTFGRGALAEVIGQPLELFAYPHGKASDQVAAAARAAGFTYAWTGRVEPTTTASDPHLLGRWEPNAIAGPAFAAQLAVRLNLADAGP